MDVRHPVRPVRRGVSGASGTPGRVRRNRAPGAIGRPSVLHIAVVKGRVGVLGDEAREHIAALAVIFHL